VSTFQLIGGPLIARVRFPPDAAADDGAVAEAEPDPEPGPGPAGEFDPALDPEAELPEAVWEALVVDGAEPAAFEPELEHPTTSRVRAAAPAMAEVRRFHVFMCVPFLLTVVKGIDDRSVGETSA
jgi:hypothetical protein